MSVLVFVLITVILLFPEQYRDNPSPFMLNPEPFSSVNREVWLFYLFFKRQTDKKRGTATEFKLV